MVAAMAVCPRNQVVGRFELCRYVLFTPATRQSRFFGLSQASPHRTWRYYALSGRSRASEADFPQCFPQVWKTGGTNRMLMGGPDLDVKFATVPQARKDGSHPPESVHETIRCAQTHTD